MQFRLMTYNIERGGVGREREIAAVINREAPHPYAAALFTDWALSEESQKYIASVLRGPTAIKHPYLPDDVKLAISDDLPADVMDRLFGYWAKHVAKSP